MLYFLVRIFVNALTVAVTILLTPGLRVEFRAESFLSLPVIYILLGTIFGLINAFIRPLVLLITGRLVIGTMGLFIFFINGLLFYVFSLLVPDILVIKVPVILWVLIAGALMAITGTILEAIFGLDSPIVDEERQSRFYWRWLGRLPRGRYNRIVQNLRLKHVYDTMRRYSLDIMIDLSPLARFRQFMQRLIYPHKHVVIEENAPQTVGLMLQELGPTYVKLGQMVASRSEILPEEWGAELSKLQSQVAPFSYEQARRIIYEELGAEPEKLFTTFEPKPFAAASMAQIHRATIPNGEDVVVKVQRPDISVTVRGDLDVMRDVTATLENRAHWARTVGLSGMLDEFSQSVIEELDYENEAFYARRLKESMSRFEYVHIPTVHSAYSTSKVITMEYVEGIKMTEVSAIDVAGIDREELARKFIRVMNKQVLLDGFFHGDPHPGNVLVNLENETIIFLDLGMMGQMTDEQRLALFDIIWSLKYGDSDNLTRILLRLSAQTREIDVDRLSKDIDSLVQRYILYAEGTPQLSKIVQEAFNLLYKYGLKLDRSLTVALKGLIQAEALVRTLAPEMSFLQTAVEEVQTTLLDQLDGEQVVDKAKQTTLRTAKDLFVRWPTWKRSAAKWALQLESGQIAIGLETRDLNKQINQVEKSLTRNVQNLVVVLLIVGMLLGSAIVSLAPLEDFRYLDFIPFDLFVIIFIIAAAFAIGYLFLTLWSIWRDRG